MAWLLASFLPHAEVIDQSTCPLCAGVLRRCSHTACLALRKSAGTAVSSVGKDNNIWRTPVLLRRTRSSAGQ
eukprot:15158936-Alexandrium_andersonii.AAC.1